MDLYNDFDTEYIREVEKAKQVKLNKMVISILTFK